MRFLICLAAALALPAETAAAAPDDPWIAYVANQVVVKQGQPSAVILRANPATGALVEVSRNGPQGNLFRRPYDLAASPRADALYVADLGAADVADGRVIRVDPATGNQTLVSEGGRLVDPAGIAVAPDGALYVLENVGAGGTPEVLRVDPATGAQSVVTSGNLLCYPFGIAIEPAGTLVVTDFGDEGEVDCPVDLDQGLVVRVHPASGAQTLVSKRALPWGLILEKPFGVAVSPSGEILVANKDIDLANSGGPDALIEVDNVIGAQTPVSPNTGLDPFVDPRRPALLPDGNLLTTDFLLDDQEGGLVHVAYADRSGTQTVLRQSRELFNNPLGLEVVVNRAPAAALRVTPTEVAGGEALGYDASGSADPEGLGLRYDWDLDGDGSFESGSGTQPTATRSFASSTSFTPRVRVTDPHGAQALAAAGAPVVVDAIRPVLAGFRASARRLAVPGPRGSSVRSASAPRAIRIRFRLSEEARVKLTVSRALPGREAKGKCVRPKRGKRPPARARCTRWRAAATLTKGFLAGPNSLRLSGRVRRRPLPAGRYRARAVATDSVGNPSRPRSLMLRAVEAPR